MPDSHEISYLGDYLLGRVKPDDFETTLIIRTPFETEVSLGKARIVETTINTRELRTELRVDIKQTFSSDTRFGAIYYKGLVLHKSNHEAVGLLERDDALAISSVVELTSLGKLLAPYVAWRRLLNSVRRFLCIETI